MLSCAHCNSTPMERSEGYGEALVRCAGCRAVFVSKELLLQLLDSDARLARPVVEFVFSPFVDQQSEGECLRAPPVLDARLSRCPVCKQLMQRVVENWGAVSLCHPHGLYFEEEDLRFFVASVLREPQSTRVQELEAFDLLVAADQPEHDASPNDEQESSEHSYDVLLDAWCRHLTGVLSF